jgi:CheY-like chemotaxis protein
MGGDVTVESNPSGGADFLATLPLERVAIETTAKPNARDVSLALIDMRVMFVEPNPISQAGLRSLLERRVDTVAFTATPGDAIAYLGSEDADVVIASFPKGGRTPAEAIDRDMVALAHVCRDAGVALVIILNSEDVGGVSSLKLPGASYLERPISAIRLTEHLENLHDLHRPLSVL